MTLRKQILLLPVFAVLIAVALDLAGMALVSRQTLNEVYEKERSVAINALRTALVAKQVEALSMARMVAAMPEVQAAVAAHDDKALETMLAGAFVDLKEQTALKQLHFHVPPATSLIRLHKLDKRGDDLSPFRPSVVKANVSGTPMMGLERGLYGVGARGIAPVRFEGKAVGTVEAGFDMDQKFLDSMVDQTGNAFEFYSIPSAEVAQGGGEQSATIARMASTFEGPELLDEAARAQLAKGGSLDLIAEIGGVEHVARAIGVRDFEGQIAGIYLVATPNDMAARMAALELPLMAGSVAISLLLATLVAWFYGRRIVARIARLVATTRLLSEGQTEVEIAQTDRRDEIGDMARALEVFRAGLEENRTMQAALRAEEEIARNAEAARLAQEQEAQHLRFAAEAQAAQQAQERAAEEQARAQDRAEQARAQIEAQRQVVAVLAAGLEGLSRGDLTAVIETPLPGEYDTLRQHFNAALHQLSAALGMIAEGAQRIDGEAAKLAHASEDLAHTSERNAAALEQTAAALDELTASVATAAEGAGNARDLAQLARGNAENGVSVVRSAVAAMAEIENSSQAISHITSVIDDIAFQTNLLALNAGVEAARAGDAGRGFAVVASEVRALAQRSSEAAREISQLISTSTDQVQGGVKLVDETGAALGRIVTSVQDIFDRLGAIAASADEQARGIAEINGAVNQLEQTIHHTTAMTEQTAASGRMLNTEGRDLIATVSAFRLTAQDAAARAAEEPFAAE